MMQEDVKNIILQILNKYDYKSIILFGSRAREDYKKDSDYDLLIVMENNCTVKELRKVQQEIRTSFKRYWCRCISKNSNDS